MLGFGSGLMPWCGGGFGWLLGGGLGWWLGFGLRRGRGWGFGWAAGVGFAEMGCRPAFPVAGREAAGVLASAGTPEVKTVFGGLR